MYIELSKQEVEEAIRGYLRKKLNHDQLNVTVTSEFDELAERDVFVIYADASDEEPT
jgi:putative N-acetylmannosamine-6-phosphate epimerase